MKKIKETVKSGVVAMLNGKFWGTQYADGQCTSYDFGTIEKAHISDPVYCKMPEDMLSENHYKYRELKQAKLVKVIVTTKYEIEE